MEKVKNFIRVWGVAIFAAICGVIAFAMVYLKAVAITGANIVGAGEYTGLHVALGFTNADVAIFKPSVGVIFAFFFPLLGACVAIIGNGNKIAAAVSSALFLTGGILALCITKLLKGDFVGTPTRLGSVVASGALSIVAAVAVLLPICLSLIGCKRKEPEAL